VPGGSDTSQRQILGSQRQILGAAVAAFAEKGFHGSTIRDIALRAGVSVPGLYHHFPSKARLLERIMDETMDALISATETAVANCDRQPADRLKAIVAAHVRFHIDFQRESFVGNTELRSLTSPGRERILRKRDRQRALFAAAVDEGLESGVFSVAYPVEATRAIVTMCTAVANWYRPNRPLKPEEIVRRYCALALLMVGYRATEEGAPHPSSNNDEEKER
jgi:AcrR family transcriptional regulator